MLFREAVPSPAVRALPLPLRLAGAAVVTGVDELLLGHAREDSGIAAAERHAISAGKLGVDHTSGSDTRAILRGRREHPMHGFSHPRRSAVVAIGIALLIVAAACAAPLQVPQRVDRLLFDAWTELTERAPPRDMLVVELPSADRFPDLLSLAHAERARLVVVALADVPPTGDSLVVGPTDVPLGSRSLRRTDWRSGGHLWFEPDIDGVVRADRRVLEDAAGTESLASYAAQLVGDSEIRDASRWLRFYPGPGLKAIPLDALLEEPSKVEDRIVVATAAMPLLLTPVGPLRRGELVAQALAGYRQHEAIVQPLAAWLAPWLLAVALLAALASRTAHSRAAPLVIAAGLTVVLTLVSAIAFELLGVWVAVAARHSQLARVRRHCGRDRGRACASRASRAALRRGRGAPHRRCWPTSRRMGLLPPDRRDRRRCCRSSTSSAAPCSSRATPSMPPTSSSYRAVDQEFRDVAKHLAHVADAPRPSAHGRRAAANAPSGTGYARPLPSARADRPRRDGLRVSGSRSGHQSDRRAQSHRSADEYERGDRVRKRRASCGKPRSRAG